MAKGSIGNISMGLSANIAGFKSSMAQAGKSLKGFESQTSMSTTNIVRSLSGLAAGYVSLQAAISAAGTAINNTLDFQGEMSKISSLGIKNNTKLGESIRDVAKTYGFDLVNAANAAYQSLSSGVSESDAGAFLRESAKAATAGVTDLQTAAELGAATINAFGGEFKDVGKKFDEAFVAVKYGVTTFEELSVSAAQAAPTFAAVGLESKEMFAAVAALTLGGQKTTRAFEGLNAAVNAIIKPSKEAEEIASNMGIAFNSTSLKSMGLSKFLQMLSEKTGGNIDTMARLLGSTEALKAVLPLVGVQAENFNKILGEMDSKTSATSEAFEAITKDNPAHEIDKMKAAFTDLGVALGTSVVPVLTEVAGLITDLLPKSKDFNTEVGSITDAFYEMAAGVNYAMSVLSLANPFGDPVNDAKEWVKAAEKAQERTAEGQQKIAEEAAKKTFDTRIAFDKTQAGVAAGQNASVGVLAPPPGIAAQSVLGGGGGILSDLMPKPFSMMDGIDKANQGKGYIDSLYDSIVTPHIEAGKQQWEMNTALEEEKKKREAVTDEIDKQMELTKEKNDLEAGFTLTKAGRLASFQPGAQNMNDKNSDGWTPSKVDEEIGLLKQIANNKAVLA
jgi:TP901 family phage tail tape measure protein